MKTLTVSALFRCLLTAAVVLPAVACSAAESGVAARVPARGQLAIVHVEGRGTVESSADGQRCSDECRMDWSQPGEPALEATPAPGWKLTGWRVQRVTRDGGAVGFLDPSFSSDVEAYSYTAVFEQKTETVKATAPRGM